MSVREIQDAVDAEAERARQPLNLQVESRHRDGPIWSLTVKVPPREDREGKLDESLEGARAWWPAPGANGGADVLMVNPESRQVHLRFATAEPPGSGESIRLYAPDFLEGLAKHWGDERRAKASEAWLNAPPDTTRDEAWAVPRDLVRVAPLRERQIDSLGLTAWKRSYLWGPPGTGKTWTIGWMIAGLLTHRSKARVLIVSSTNAAVDQALIAVDQALGKLRREDLRRACKRVGTRYDAENYLGHEHLLPTDRRLLEQKVEHEARRPDRSMTVDYHKWKLRAEELEVELRQSVAGVLATARVAAMTAARAVFALDVIRDGAPWDVLIFDEASQIGIAHAAAIAPLAARVVFAGDPKQLAPIVKSDGHHPHAGKWLGRSMFAYRGSCSVLLDEQSRMAAPICALVGGLFYEKRLRVARDAEVDKEWQRERALRPCGPLARRAVSIIAVEGDVRWNRFRVSPERPSSASKTIELARRIRASDPSHRILVLTPFVAQRALIRKLLRANPVSNVEVSTVHRAQGSECHTVLFDPVDANGKFFIGEAGERLINVAFSRAKARLVLLVSEADMKNEVIQRAKFIVEGRALLRAPQDLGALVRSKESAASAAGTFVRAGDVTGEVKSVGATEVVVRDVTTGREHRFRLRELRGTPAAAPKRDVAAARSRNRRPQSDVRGELEEQLGDDRVCSICGQERVVRFRDRAVSARCKTTTCKGGEIAFTAQQLQNVLAVVAAKCARCGEGLQVSAEGTLHCSNRHPLEWSVLILNKRR